MTIYNSELVLKFFDNYLSFGEDEVVLIVGGARKKYARDNPDLSTSHEVVARKIVRHDKGSDFLLAVQKVSAILKISMDKKTGKRFPKESLAIYASVNKKSAVRAWFDVQTKMNSYFREKMINNNNVVDVICE